MVAPAAGCGRARGRRRAVREGSEMPSPDDALTAALARAVDAGREDAVRLLQRLVRVPSVTGDEGAVQDAVARAFGDRGLAVDRWEFTAAEIAPYRLHVGDQ